MESRNQALAELTRTLIARSRTKDLPIWDIVVALLAHGAYQLEPAPDPIEVILAASPGFAGDEFGIWTVVRPESTAAAGVAPQLAQTHNPRRGVRRIGLAQDLVSAIEMLAERIQADPSAFTARRAGTEIVDASRLLRDLLEPEKRPTDRKSRRRQTKPKILQLKCTLKQVERQSSGDC